MEEGRKEERSGVCELAFMVWVSDIENTNEWDVTRYITRL